MRKCTRKRKRTVKRGSRWNIVGTFTFSLVNINVSYLYAEAEEEKYTWRGKHRNLHACEYILAKFYIFYLLLIFIIIFVNYIYITNIIHTRKCKIYENMKFLST